MNDCNCKSATLTAYREVKQRGLRDDWAFETAVRVCRHHHPEYTRQHAYSIVADWLDNDVESELATH